MNIFMWSGPRNISTALLRSFSNRDDTVVYDEPFYSYYLNETKLDHPMKDQILNYYPTDESKVIKSVTKSEDKIFYQKHMTHHILNKTDLNWLNRGVNCFLIRHPSKVINSYIKKNELTNITDIGFDQIFRLFNYVIDNITKNIIVVNADILLEDPEKYLKKLCNKLEINFTSKMLNWEKGLTKDFGIWYSHWYHDIINSNGFKKTKNTIMDVPQKYEKIYIESLKIYNHMNKYAL